MGSCRVGLLLVGVLIPVEHRCISAKEPLHCSLPLDLGAVMPRHPEPGYQNDSKRVKTHTQVKGGVRVSSALLL